MTQGLFGLPFTADIQQQSAQLGLCVISSERGDVVDPDGVPCTVEQAVIEGVILLGKQGVLACGQDVGCIAWVQVLSPEIRFKPVFCSKA